MAHDRTFISTPTDAGMRTDVVLQDKRAHPRKSVQVAARLRTDGRPPLVGITLDISEQGISVLIADKVEVGQTWEMSFDLFFDGRDHRFDVRVEVMHTVYSADGVKVGFRFVRLGMQSLIVLSKYLR